MCSSLHDVTLMPEPKEQRAVSVGTKALWAVLFSTWGDNTISG